MKREWLMVLGLAACSAPGSGNGGDDSDASVAADSATIPSTSSVGTNLTGLADWSAEWAFIDAFKASRSWISGSASAWDDGRTLALDARGWVTSLQPGQIARTLVLPEGHYPAGAYVVLYDGAGTLEYGGGGSRDAARSTPGRDVVNVSGTAPVIINLTATTASDPLRNIRFLMPGGVCSNDGFRACDPAHACDGSGTCEAFEDVYATQIFHPTFLSRVRGYRTLRFMDWLATNNSTVSDHAARLDDARWTNDGVPIEIAVELANRLGADAWLDIPHLATDGYVQEVAALVHDRLAPGLRVYIEYSNEIWNSIFSQGTYAEQRGVALGLASTPFEARLRYQSQRSVEIFQIFESVFADDHTRIVRVLAAQAANPWTSQVLLDHDGAYQHADALAIAPYFGGYLGGPGQVGTLHAMDLDDLFTELDQHAVPEAVGWVANQAKEARSRGLALVAYEAGNHLVGIQGVENDAAVNALFDAANRDPRMKDVYTRYLEGWKDSGGQLLVHFVNCSAPLKWGRWGALEYLEQPRADAPKYDAIQSFIETYPAWW